MADDDGDGSRPLPGPNHREDHRATLTTGEVRAFVERAPRCKVRIAVLCQPPGVIDFVETQLVNISRSGMFLASTHLLELGTTVEFQFSLDDGLVVLNGNAEVMRLTESGERGMGLRFAQLDEQNQRLVDRIVEANSAEPPPVPAESGPTRVHLETDGKPIEYGHGSLRITLSAATAAYFTYNPLLHIGIGGCFIPADGDVPLGTGYQLDVVHVDGRLLLRCKAKVAAKQERRIGIRLLDVDRPALLALRAEIAKLAPAA